MRKVLYILGQLDDQDIEWLAATGRRLSLATGHMLIRRGTQIDDVFIVLDGELAVLSPKGKEIARIGAGDILGEMSLVDETPTSADVKLLAASRVLAVPRQAIKERLAGDLPFAARFYKAIAIFLADRMRHTLARFGYGESSTDESDVLPDELDVTMLDTVHVAGGRFERLLKMLNG